MTHVDIEFFFTPKNFVTWPFPVKSCKSFWHTIVSGYYVFLFKCPSIHPSIHQPALGFCSLTVIVFDGFIQILHTHLWVGRFEEWFGIFNRQKSVNFCPCLPTFFFYRIEVFYFADKSSFSVFYNKQHLWFGHKMYYFIIPSNTPFFTVLLLHSGRVLCSVCDAFFLIIKNNFVLMIPLHLASL